MSDSALNPEMICQVGFIVRDIESTAQRFSEVFGLPRPKIHVTPGHEIAETTYQGEPSDATAKLAFFNTGQVQIELIEPDEKPSVWRDFLEQHGEGVHHIAFQVPDTKMATNHLAKSGIGICKVIGRHFRIWYLERKWRPITLRSLASAFASRAYIRTAAGYIPTWTVHPHWEMPMPDFA